MFSSSPPPLYKQTHTTIACADTGSDKILIRLHDAVKASLDITATPTPLSVIFPDGATATSIGTTSVALPSTSIALPAHVFDDSSLGQSLFSIAEITQRDVDATFSKSGLHLYHDGTLVHFSAKDPDAVSWQLPICRPVQLLSSANAVISLPSDKKFVDFMHASFGSPAISTFLKALRRNYLPSLPRLTSSLVSRHSPNTVATALGHLDQTRSGIDSTEESHTSNSSENKVLHNIPTDQHPEDTDPYIYTKLSSTADADASGRFPIQSISKDEYQLVSYYGGYIHVEPMSSRHHTSYIAAYDKTFTFWAQYGPLPDVLRLDNETSHALEVFVATRVKSFQYFPPGNHRANRAERAMRTWKNHFIATLATASPQFPMKLWNKLLPLAELTLNCLLPWHHNPSISAFHGLTGAPFDFRAHPIAPAGTAILIHDKASERPTWAAHGTPGFYIGPALLHYRCHHVHSTITSAPRITDTIAWFPETDVTPPKISTAELLLAAILALTKALKSNPLLCDTALSSPMVQDIIDLASLHVSAQPDAIMPPAQTIELPIQPLPLHAREQRVVPLDTPPPHFFSPPPGLPALPVPRTDQPNRLLEDNQTVAIPEPTHRHLTRSSTAWTRNPDNPPPFASANTAASAPHLLLPPPDNIDHLSRSNAAVSLNSNLDGSPLTYKSALSGPNRAHWEAAEAAEISRLLDTGTMHPIQQDAQPLDRRRDTTYYNPKPKEKLDADDTKLYRIRGTIGGDRVNYDGPTKANTAAMPIVKLLLQSTVSENAEWMTIDLKDFYLMTGLPRPEYIRIPIRYLSTAIIAKYSLQSFIHNGHILFEVLKSMYGLPHAGRIAQEALIAHLAQHGYVQTSTPCLFRHITNNVFFTLVVDDFGVKYRTPADADHLIQCLKLKYSITLRMDGAKYLGLNIAFDRQARTVSLSLPGYVRKALSRFAPSLTNLAHSPGIYTPPSFGKESQNVALPDTSRPLSDSERTNLQAIIGVFLYYCLAVDVTGLPAVTALASAQSCATTLTQAAALRLLAYFRNYPDNSLVLKACKMRLHMQSDASYQTRSFSRSVGGGIAYLSNDDPTEVNGAIQVFSSIIPAVMASVGEAEYVALFMTGQMGAGLRQILHDLGYPQPPTYILVDNQVAHGIATNTIQPKRTKSIDMKYHWIRDRVAMAQFTVIWRKGVHNLADFFTKPLPVHAHRSLMPLLVHVPPSSPAKCSRAALRSVSWRNLQLAA